MMAKNKKYIPKDYIERHIMNQRHLTYFLEVYKHRSISAAAKSLFISPQGLSKTILALEEELGG